MPEASTEEVEAAPAAASPVPAESNAPVEDAVLIEEPETRQDDPPPATEPAVAADQPSETAPTSPEADESDIAPPTPAPQIVEKVTVQKVGFGPALLGGAFAAALGLFGGYILFGQDNGDLAALSDRVSVLENSEAPTVDLTGLESSVAELSQRVSTGAEAQVAAVAEQVAALQSGLDAQSDRLAALERAPSTDGTLTEDALAAWQSDLSDIRQALADQQARMDTLATEATAAAEAIRTEAASLEANAATAGQLAEARAAVGRILAALETGSGYGDALADFSAVSDVPVAPVLSANADTGVTPLTELQDSFPETARQALAVARAEGVDGAETSGFLGFLQSTLDVRSTTPRDGDDPDAILSRAEAALRDNRLGDALAEIGSLPEVVRGAMSGWVSEAEVRGEAIAAAEALNQTLSEE